jgi:hypothetical protein
LGSAAIDTNNLIYFFTYQGAKASTAKKEMYYLDSLGSTTIDANNHMKCTYPGSLGSATIDTNTLICCCTDQGAKASTAIITVLTLAPWAVLQLTQTILFVVSCAKEPRYSYYLPWLLGKCCNRHKQSYLYLHMPRSQGNYSKKKCITLYPCAVIS